MAAELGCKLGARLARIARTDPGELAATPQPARIALRRLRSQNLLYPPSWQVVAAMTGSVSDRRRDGRRSERCF